MSLLDLPEEVIEIILCKNNVSLQDFVNFSSTCTYFHRMLNSNTFWRWKFYMRWPRLKNVCQNELNEKDFKEVVSVRISCGNTVRHYLTQMSEKCYESIEEIVSHKRRFSSIVYDNTYVAEKDLHSLLHSHNYYGYSVNYHFLVDELTSIIEQSQSKKNYNFTHNYYGRKLLTYLKRYHVKKQWQKFTERPAQQQLFEEVTTIFFQLYQPAKELLYSDVDKDLDNLAQDVITNLKQTHPMHPLLTVSREQLSFWRCNNINQTEVENSDVRSILVILYKILFENNPSLCTAYSQTYVFINMFLYDVSNEVLSYCIEEVFHGFLVRGILLQSAARRLGVLCDLIYIDTNNSFLIWMPKNDTTKVDRVKGFSIHLQKWSPTLLEKYLSEIRVLNNHTYMKMTSAQLLVNLIEFMINNHEEKINVDEKIGLTEFQYMMKPDIDSFRDLLQAYTEAGMKDNTLKLLSNSPQKDENSKLVHLYVDLLEEKVRTFWKRFSLDCPFYILLQTCEERYNFKDTIKPKKRKRNMKLSVGMIGYMGTPRNFICCVIIGWKEVDLSYSLVVCCDDSTLHCISEDCFKKGYSPEPFNVDALDKYFCRFEGTYYLPNELLAVEYPEDVSFLLKNTYPVNNLLAKRPQIGFMFC